MKISDLLFWPVFFPSPTSYFLNVYSFHFSPPSPSLKLFQKHRNCARLTQIFSVWKQPAQAFDSWRNWAPEWTRLQKLCSELQEEGTVVTHRIWWTRTCRVWITVSLDHMYWDTVFLEGSLKIWSSSSWESTGDSSENPPHKGEIIQCCAPRDSVCSCASAPLRRVFLLQIRPHFRFYGRSDHLGILQAIHCNSHSDTHRYPICPWIWLGLKGSWEENQHNIQTLPLSFSLKCFQVAHLKWMC